MKRALAILAPAFALMLGLPQAEGATAEDEFSKHLEILRKPKPGWALWHLAEARSSIYTVRNGKERLVALAHELLGRKRLPDLLRGELHALLGRSAATPAAGTHLTRAGYPSEFYFLGPLQGAGHEKKAPTKVGSSPSPGVYGATYWRKVKHSQATQALRNADLIHCSGDCHAEVDAWIDTKTASQLSLVVSSNGPVKAWFDGKLVLEWDGDRRFRPWQHAVTLKVAPGHHSVRLVYGHREKAPEVAFHIVDNPDGTLNNSRFIPRPERPVMAEARLDPAASLKPEDRYSEDLELHARLQLHFGVDRGALANAAEIFAKATARKPTNPALWELLARAHGSEAENKARSAWRNAVALSPTGRMNGIAHLYTHARRAQRRDEAAALCREANEREPNHPIAVECDIDLARAALGNAAALAALTTRLGSSSRSTRVALLEQELLQSSQQTMRAAKLAAKLSLDLGGHIGLMRSAASGYSLSGRQNALLPKVRELLNQRPFAVDAHILYADLASSEERSRVQGAVPAFELSLASLSEALIVQPNAPELYEARGRIRFELGERPAALDDLDRALAMKPQNQDLALWRRTLTRGQSSADQYAKPVEAIIARSKTFEPASEGATVLLDNQVIRIHRNALTTRFRQRLIRVDSAASGETLTAIQLPYTPRVERLQVLRANVLRKDGSVERPVRMTDHRPAGRQNGIYTLTAYKTILFPKLEVGDIVHVQSESHDIADRGLFGPHFGALLPTQGPWPTLQARWVLEVPPELRLKTQVVGRGQWVEKTDTLDADGSLRLSWEATNLPAVRFEPSMPGYSDVAGYIQASSFTSWPELVRWYQGFIRDQLRLTPKLTALARTLTDGKHSIRTKVAAIHRWVVDNIRYVGIEFGIHGFKPYSLEEIVERGYGDCKDKAALFVALLDAVGIESDFALIRTRDRGSVGNDIASLWVFNHAIAYVPALDVYVDATSERALLGEVPALDQGGLLLRFPIVGSHRHTGVLTHLPFTPAPSNEFRSLGTIRLRADGSASATFNERIVGTAAAAMRSMLESPAEQSQRLGRLIARQHSGSVLRSFKVHAEGKGGTGGFELELEAELPSFAKRQGDELIIPVHSDPGGLLKKFASLGQRKHPLHLPYLSQDTTVSTVLTPGGAVATTVPEDKTVASTFGTYSLQVKRHSEGLRIEEVLTLDVSIINPKDYPAFRAFLEQVVGARRGRIVLRVGGKSVVSEPAQNTTND